jgi:Cu/Zn superoxide dismutase
MQAKSVSAVAQCRTSFCSWGNGSVRLRFHPLFCLKNEQFARVSPCEPRAIAGVGAVAALLILAAPASADQLRTATYLIDATGAVAPVGEVLVAGGDGGARFLVEMRGPLPGEYELRIHTEAECGPGTDQRGAMAPGLAAGDLWRPSDGAAQVNMVADRPPPVAGGDDGSPPNLPTLRVARDGRVIARIEEPRIADATQLWHRSLVLHDPSGRRIACGVID